MRKFKRSLASRSPAQSPAARITATIIEKPTASGFLWLFLRAATTPTTKKPTSIVVVVVVAAEKSSHERFYNGGDSRHIHNKTGEQSELGEK